VNGPVICGIEDPNDEVALVAHELVERCNLPLSPVAPTAEAAAATTTRTVA